MRVRRLKSKETYIRFQVAGFSESGKTQVWNVLMIRHGLEPLGEIRWFGRWRQYAFFPRDDTLYSPDCLHAIADHISKLMVDRRHPAT